MNESKRRKTKLESFPFINFDNVRNRLLEEKQRYGNKWQEMREEVGLKSADDSNIFGATQMPPSFEYIVKVAYITKKPIDYFLYDEPMFQNLVKEEFIKIPYIETFTGPENELVYKNRRHMCAMRYDSLLKISNDPSRTILYVMDSDSMESTICKGDELLIDTTKKLVKDGAIYAFNSYDIKYIRIRRCFCEINTIQLIPDNDRKYGIYIAKNSDINIIGQVIMSKHFL